jgi:ketosteroid isomerase-like protein
MAGNGELVIGLDAQRMAASAAKDVATLEKLIADDLIYVHSTARMDTKETLIGAMVSGKTVYTGMQPSEVVAQEFGDTVVLSGVCAISVVAAGNPRSFKVRFVDVWNKRPAGWQMVTWQSTLLPE